MMPEDKQKEKYELVGNDVLAWRLSASKLLASARVLEKNYDFNAAEDVDEGHIFPTIFLLTGFGIECLLKALWLSKGKEKFIQNGQFVRIKNIGSHELHGLADKMDFKLNQAERSTLITLSNLITSTGRYPVPVKFNDAKIQKFNDGSCGSRTNFHSRDLRIGKQIIDRINSQLG